MVDPTKDEMLATLADDIQMLEADEFDTEAAIYWFACEWHDGQQSNLYSALSTSKYRPGSMAYNAADESETAQMLYDVLENAYTERVMSV